MDRNIRPQSTEIVYKDLRGKFIGSVLLDVSKKYTPNWHNQTDMEWLQITIKIDPRSHFCKF